MTNELVVLTHSEAKQLRDSTCMNDPLALIYATEIAILKKQATQVRDPLSEAWPNGEPNWLPTCDKSKALHDIESKAIKTILQGSPPVREPLTTERIAEIWQSTQRETPGTWFPLIEFARAIEAAH